MPEEDLDANAVSVLKRSEKLSISASCVDYGSVAYRCPTTSKEIRKESQQV
jgi:hypothetical protein